MNEVTLDELKERVNNHVSKHKSIWSSMNDGRGVENMINEAKDYKELILMFR